MGTNYYLRFADSLFLLAPPFFKSRKDFIQDSTKLHIGKSSGGWRFLFREQIVENKRIDSYARWQELIKDEKYEIINEYNEEIDKGDFFKLVESKQKETEHDVYNIPTIFRSRDGYDFDSTWFS